MTSKGVLIKQFDKKSLEPTVEQTFIELLSFIAFKKANTSSYYLAIPDQNLKISKLDGTFNF